MTTTTDTRLMPAPHPTDSTAWTGMNGKGVKHVSVFEPRKGRSARAWDELSEVDRQVLLESVRQRRKVQERQSRLYNQVYGLRHDR